MWHRTTDRRPRPRLRSAPAPRRRWAARPVEALEGRALLATSALDPTFGTGGVALSPLIASGGIPFGPFVTVDGSALQADGKVVTAEVDLGNTLEIRRYDADGSVDATFGTDGQATIPLPAGATAVAASRHLAITATGQILVAVDSTTASLQNNTSTTEGLVVRLTGAGALDSTFGAGGEVALPGTFAAIDSVAVEAGGRIVVAGLIPANTGVNTTSGPEAVVLGLTDAGAPDPTFGAGGQAVVPLATASVQPAVGSSFQLQGLRLTPDGQILLGVTYSPPQPLPGPLATTPLDIVTISRLDADGTIDAAFGTGGTATSGLLVTSPAIDFVAQADGRIVLVGSQTEANQAQPGTFPSIARLTAAGAPDPTFAPPNLLGGTPLGGFVAVVVGTDGAITALQSDGTLRRFTGTGAIDSAFGRGGQIPVAIPGSFVPSGSRLFSQAGSTLDLTPSGSLVVGGDFGTTPRFGGPGIVTSQNFLARALPITLSQAPNDYDGTGRSDLALQLGDFGAFAYRTAAGDTVQPFGAPGAGNTIPAPGDYDGDGKADVAAYLPSLGILADRPSSGGADVYIRFGPTGTGTSVAVPVPGDYDGDGRTDVALYLPASSTFIVDPSSGAAPYAVQFGPAGLGNAIPAPGDYDGDGRADFALYLPASGAFAIDPSSGAAPYAVSFGQPGAGNTIPAPGDYDGDGKADIAAYLPQFGVFADRPSGGGADVLTTFGPAGAGAAIPVPGDYDGDGRADIALYLPGNSVFAIDPSGGATPYAQQFGNADPGITVPATTVVIPTPAIITGTDAAIPGGTGGVAASSVPNYLPDDLPGVTSIRKKPKA